MKEQQRIPLWQEKSLDARKLVLEAIHAAGSGHLGGAMSILDALVVLYSDVMNIDPKNPKLESRDRFVMSKGHASPAIYVVLAMEGFFPKEWLKTLNHNGTNLPSHCDMNKVPGIDMTAGSLGQGISCACGMALAGKLSGKDYSVYCVVGDGECQEGEVWEAVLFAAQKDLDNFYLLVDNNGGQVDGYTATIVNVDPLHEKFKAFGWDTFSVNGHDHAEIFDAISLAKKTAGKPHAIVLNTIKAKGVSGYEGTERCHHLPIDDNEYARIVKELQ